MSLVEQSRHVSLGTDCIENGGVRGRPLTSRGPGPRPYAANMLGPWPRLLGEAVLRLTSRSA